MQIPIRFCAETASCLRGRVAVVEKESDKLATFRLSFDRRILLLSDRSIPGQ